MAAGFSKHCGYSFNRSKQLAILGTVGFSDVEVVTIAIAVTGNRNAKTSNFFILVLSRLEASSPILPIGKLSQNFT
jgi:hypothetical protein